MIDYLVYRPHFALPFAASEVVMPLEQDSASKTVTASRSGRTNFFLL
ncbi:MAG: hypothetical protein ABIQ31_02075 [Ferruginibacter sp.]